MSADIPFLYGFYVIFLLLCVSATWERHLNIYDCLGKFFCTVAAVCENGFRSFVVAGVLLR